MAHGTSSSPASFGAKLPDDEQDLSTSLQPNPAFAAAAAGEGFIPNLSQASGIAPRTFEVIQRELLKKERDELLGTYDKAAIGARRSAAELSREGVRGVPTGSGVRAAAARRMAQEMGPILTGIETKKAEKAYETRPDIMAGGDISSDRMLKMTTYEQLIQQAWDDGKDMGRIGQMIRTWIKLEPDPEMKLWLLDRGMGYPGFGPSPGEIADAQAQRSTDGGPGGGPGGSPGGGGGGVTFSGPLAPIATVGFQVAQALDVFDWLPE